MKMQMVRMDGQAIRAPIDGSRVVRFRASTPTQDRHGTIVMPEGIQTANFDRNPVFIWGHDAYGSMFGSGPDLKSVIGRVISHSKSPQAFDIEVEFVPPSVSETADQAFKMVKSGFLNAVSIGFNPMKWHDEQVDGGERRVFDQVDLLEVSLVPIPSNPDAVALTRHVFGETIDINQLQAVNVMLRAGRVLSTRNKNILKEASTYVENALEKVRTVINSQPDDEPDDDQTQAAAVETQTQTKPDTEAKGFDHAAYSRAASAAITSVLLQRAILHATSNATLPATQTK